MRRAASSTGRAADQSPLANPLHQLLPTNRLVTPGELAAALAVSARTVTRLIKAGELPAFRIGNATRIRPQDVIAFLNRANAGDVDERSEELDQFIRQQLRG